ncbi:inositol monophosphatase family protein [Nocardia sp. NPDC006630]|uniref:inositol monophosphatase family protein n=1 Tax=Nocardia sp. NPDC006630 TaxID=3157181 RepID=UPI0033B2D12C
MTSATIESTQLDQVVAAVRMAGARQAAAFTAMGAVPGDWEEIRAALTRNDQLAEDILRPRLQALRPQADWAGEFETGLLGGGEWWVADTADGNINAVHGLPEWTVAVSLVRDDTALLTVVHAPLSGDTYTALRGGGAFRNGLPIHASRKTDLALAIAATAQAAPGHTERSDDEGRSIAAMYRKALVVRSGVPSTQHLARLSAGQLDVYWLHGQDRAATVAGALLVSEAGGVVTDISGRAWTPASGTFLAAAPGVHAAAVTALTEH